MIPFFLKYWRIILPALAVIGVCIALWGWGRYKYNQGYEASQTAYELALFQAQQKFQFELSKQARGYDTASKKIREAADGGCVGPANGVLIDWLHQNRIGE